MTDLIETVDMRTDIAGKNRVELLLFKVSRNQFYGINVFKVREIMTCPKLTKVPDSHEAIRGIVKIRGFHSLAVISLNKILHDEFLDHKSLNTLMIAEYNRRLIGLLVSEVDQIIQTSWQKIHSPPKGLNNTHFLTAITQHDKKIIEILDIEKILETVMPPNLTVSESAKSKHHHTTTQHTVLLVDDSRVAKRQIANILDQLKVQYITASDGIEAFEMLTKMVEGTDNINSKLLMMLSDIEMPNMDGYTLTSKCREHPKLKDLYIVLNTSISGEFNQQMAKRVKADQFLAKINGDEIANVICERRKVAALS
ncbi:response regulator [Piscirickettsia salmonis]|nr:response regulator [Piscirickettsia salmonis]